MTSIMPTDDARDPYRDDLDADGGFRPEDPSETGRMIRKLALPVLAMGTLVALVPVWADRGAEPAKAEAGESFVVPFRMLPSNHMVVQTKLNGKGPYRLIFDLGSPVTLLSNRAAEASGAIPKDAPRSFLFGTRGEGKLDTMELGELVAEEVPVVIMDHPALKALGGMLGRPLDGIVGYTFFARYKTTIDYQANEMTFTPVEFEVRDLLAELPKRMMGPKVARSRVLAPESLWGLTLGEAEGGVEAQGVRITSVLAGSPADKAGLRAGDLLATLDGRWTATPADVYEAAAGVPKDGLPISAVVIRDGAEVDVSVTPVPGI